MARPATGRLVLACLLGAGAVGAAIGLMATSAWLISRASQRPPESALALAIVGVQFFALSRAFLRYGERLVAHDAALRTLASLRSEMTAHLETVAPAGLPAFRSGDLLARLVGDIDSLQDVAVRIVPPFVVAAVVGTATVALDCWLLGPAGVILLLSLLAAATAVPWLTSALAVRSERTQADARGELTAAVVDLVEGAADLAAFGATAAQLGRISAADAKLTAVASAGAETAGVGAALTTLLVGLATVGALLVGIPAVHEDRLDGTLLAVIALIPTAAFELVAPLPVATQLLQRVRRAAGRVFAVSDTAAPVDEPLVAAALPGPPHVLDAASVSARYPGQPQPAIHDVDLFLPPSRRVAIVGPSGAGKSALAAVLVRFLDDEAGSVRIDGTELSALAGDDVRAVVGLVTQDAHVFDATLADNLRVGRPGATDEELRRALERVGLRAWVECLPDGLDTAVGERGDRLSGGQRQRLVVARALLADFPILVLDEPAEHLDEPAADALTAQLLAATSGRSTVLVSHRLAGLDAVDEVVVLDRGAVVERGRPDRLLTSGGPYAALWRREASAAEGAGPGSDGVESIDGERPADTGGRDTVHTRAPAGRRN